MYELDDTDGAENTVYLDNEKDLETNGDALDIKHTTAAHMDTKLRTESSATAEVTDHEEGEEGDLPLPWYFKISWLLSDIITPVAPIVTVVFFGALWTGFPLDIFNINTHALNSVLVFLDQVISARPIRLLHVVAPIIYGFVYNIFNLIYWTFDHEEHLIYPGVIDWNTPGRTILNVFAIAFVLIPTTTFMWFLFYRFKLAIYTWRHGDSK
ncbi:protein rolling stone-like [Elysia marginata]|uniref:Protein rolling stone-like n=1 Tax=Elysia marginata TaxID=1093978 RepID=A0AAV4J0Y4_9GAST|nr:protein rolling stone-like [Elysia marginata]